MAWWEDEDQNPDIHYLDYSRRKILFEDPYYGFQRRRRSDRTFFHKIVQNAFKVFDKRDQDRGIRLHGY